jgi:AAA+ superfamily predicted ATPase|tara:strand:+ start:2443 stop:3792 length:1350 start_codon:yes stop_codon:yes gene_type:complete
MERTLKIGNGTKGSLNQPLFEIGLEPIYELVEDIMEMSKQERDFMSQKISDYLGEGYESENHFIDGFKRPYYLDALHNFSQEHFKDDGVVDYSFRRNCEVPPSKKTFKINGIDETSLIYKGAFFYEEKDNPENRLVVWITPYSEDMSLEVEVYYSDYGQYSRTISRFKEYFNENHPLDGRVVDARWNIIETKDVGWDDIILTPKQKQVIQRNILKFVENIENYESKGLATSRGILLTGPPGTGKTLCCEVIINQLGGSAIYVSTDSISEVGDIRSVYSLARKMSPCLVIVEDIDTLGGLDRTVRGGEHPLLGEFLNCLAGMGENSGVITIATTNYAQHLDAALADRPGRFDVRLEFGLPNEELRRHILNKYLKDVGTKLNVDEIIDHTKGLSGAYLKEIVMTSYMIALENDSKKVKQTHLMESVKEVISTKIKNKPNFKKSESNERLYG